MKFKALPLFLALGLASSAHAAPKFWENPSETPTPLPAPPVQTNEAPAEYDTATPTPVVAPVVEIPSPTPTPMPGLRAKNPTHAALFSVFVPGSGQVYAGDPVKGIVFAALFGVGLWQTLDNLSLVPDSGGNNLGTNNSLVAKNETLGNLFGLGTLAVYGFGIQDAFNTAVSYNKTNHLTLSLGIYPRASVLLAYRF